MTGIIRIDNIRRSAPRRAQNNRNYEFEISSRRGSEGNGNPKRAHVIPPLSRSSPHSKVVPSSRQKPASADFGNRQNEEADPPCIGGYPHAYLHLSHQLHAEGR